MKNALLPDDFDFQNSIPLWTLDQSQTTIYREFTFVDFKQAFQFMSLCSQYAEEIDHHPDWSNSYNTVTIALTSHDKGCVTQRDSSLAEQINTLV